MKLFLHNCYEFSCCILLNYKVDKYLIYTLWMDWRQIGHNWLICNSHNGQSLVVLPRNQRPCKTWGQVKHESNIGLLNQLFDGSREKSSFANLHEWVVPQNSTSMSLGLQPQPFFCALTSIGKTVWMDSRFAKHSLFTTVKPFRYN